LELKWVDELSGFGLCLPPATVFLGVFVARAHALKVRNGRTLVAGVFPTVKGSTSYAQDIHALLLYFSFYFLHYFIILIILFYLLIYYYWLWYPPGDRSMIG
jgi:heme A synthase